MLNLYLLKLLSLVTLWKYVASYPNGNVETACYDMVPRHGSFQSNYSQSDFGIYVEDLGNNNTYLTFQRLAVIVNTSSSTFRGFMLQVRLANDTDRLPVEGYWEPADSYSKTLDCFGMRASTIVHTANVDLYTMTAYWVPTKYISSQLVVVGTVVQNYRSFYPNIVSNVFSSSSHLRSSFNLLILCLLKAFV